MAFSNGQNVQAADLNNFSVTTVTTTGNTSVGGNLAVTGTSALTGNTTITGTLTVGGVEISTTIDRSVCCGRLSLTSGSPVTTADVTAATTLYYALYSGNQIALYSGTAWALFAIAELSIAVPATTNQMYDVFVDYNGGTPQLALTAWTNDTTRATALTKQDGVLVKTGATGQRYVGSFRTTGVSGQTEDSYAKRYVWNHYNRVPRPMRVVDATDSWTYTTATIRQANNSTANQLDFVIGVSEDAVEAHVLAIVSNDTGSVTVTSAIGLDSTTAAATGSVIGRMSAGANLLMNMAPSVRTFPGIGRHTLVWLEASSATGITTWYGDAGTPTLVQSGIMGTVLG